MLPTHLTTNEVKDTAGAEVEFLRSYVDQRQVQFSKSGAMPNLPALLGFKHQELGTGFKLRRRSQFWVRLTSISTVDSITPVQCLGYVVLDTPCGAITSYAQPQLVMAHLNSVLSTTGVGTTVLFDGSGYGTDALVKGTL